jgi:uncharacterized protein
MPATTTPLRIQLSQAKSISAILRAPATPLACLVFAHGPGAGMNHPFMSDMASALAERRIASRRFQFARRQATLRGRLPPASN